jgi:hypothetical protein
VNKIHAAHFLVRMLATLDAFIFCEIRSKFQMGTPPPYIIGMVFRTKHFCLRVQNGAHKKESPKNIQEILTKFHNFLEEEIVLFCYRKVPTKI